MNQSRATTMGLPGHGNWWCVLFFGACCLAFAPTSQAEDQTSSYVLDNGMTVLIHEMPTSQSVAIDALVKVGSSGEGKFLGSGVAHFVEHMLFKGTPERTVGKIPEEVQALGGYINASTGTDWTVYKLDLPSRYANQAVDIVGDMLMNSVFDPKETEKEREVIFGEMRMRNDDPDIIISEMTNRTVFQRHPYRYPIIGHQRLLADISRDELFEFYKTHYIPNNIIFGISGNVRAEEILPVVKAVFQDFVPRPYLVRNLPHEPEQVTPRHAQGEYPMDLARMVIAYQGVSIGHRDMFTLDVLAMILGAGRSSRLYKILVDERKLVQSISVFDDTPMDQGSFEINCVLEEKNIDEVVGIIDEEIERIKSEGVTRGELQKAKRQVMSSQVFSRQTASDINYDQVINQYLTGDYDFSRKYVESVSAVTARDVKMAAREYLRGSTQSTVVLRPRKENPSLGTTILAPEKTPWGIQKYTLDNGLKILLKKDPRVPIVTLNLALQGGLRQEPEGLFGLSNLTASLWTKGTKSLTARTIDETVESLGGDLGGYSGNNSLGLRMNFLKKDLEFAINLLEDLIKNPAFPQAEIDKNKEQIRKNLLQQKEEVLVVSNLAVQETLFPQHPYRFNPLGSPESLAKMSRQDILEFYRRFCVGPNMVLSVYGDIDPGAVLEVLKKKFDSLSGIDPGLKYFVADPLTAQRQRTETLDKEQAVIMVGFLGPALGSPDEFGVEILTNIIGGGMNSRLFVKVREDLGRAYHLRGRYTPGLDTGTVSFYAATDPGSLNKVREVLMSVISDVAENGVTEKELADMKVYLKGRHDMSLETIGALAGDTTLQELYGLGFDRYLHYNAAIDSVTLAGIRRMAKQYLDLNRAAVVVTAPQQEH